MSSAVGGPLHISGQGCKENFRPERHNLFLSHAGEDKTFVRILHENLKKRHHSPFLDQERDSLPLGSHYPTTIVDGLSRCQVIVFVLSEHFVTKKWPMVELVTAWRLPENLRPRMFPIFYKLDVGMIDETNLRKWGKTWQKQAEKDPQVKVNDFKKALQDLTKHSGVLKSSDLDDYKFAEKVVSEICKVVTPIKLWATDGMQKEEEFCKLVCDQLMQGRGGKYRILGLWGPSGSGKTWLAMAVCRYFYNEYGGWVAFIDCAKKKDKLGMARALYLSLSGEELDQRVDGDSAAKNRVVEFVKEKSFFVVLDNLPLTQDGSTVTKFALEILSEHCKECKVLITARDEAFLDTLLKPFGDAASDITKVPNLDKETAANMLLGLAFPSQPWNTLTNEEKKAVHRVCKLYLEDVSFNPLLIKVLGMYIRRQSEQLQCSSLLIRSLALVNKDASLKMDLDSKLFSLLNEQFQSMTESHLQAFCIDAALYDVAIETTVNGICSWLSIIHGCRPNTVLKKLEEVAFKGLLKWDATADDDDPEIITSNTFAKFAMRQVLEKPEMWGWFFYSGIAEKEEKTEQDNTDKEEKTQVPLHDNTRKKKKSEVALPHDSDEEDSEEADTDEDEEEETNETDEEEEGETDESEETDEETDEGEGADKGEKTLLVDDITSKKFEPPRPDMNKNSNQFAPPRPNKPKRIEKIALVGGDFQDVGEVLNLTHYTKAVAMVVSRCDKLEELNVEWNTRLKVLEVEDCGQLDNIEGLEDLTQLVCLRVVSAPITNVELRLNNLWRLQKLEICDTKMSKLPDLQGCVKLRELILDDTGLQSLPESWTGFPCLAKVSFAGNDKIIALPDLSPLASVLRDLDISYCEKLERAECIPRLTSLQKLNLDYCSALVLQRPDLEPLRRLDSVSTPRGLLAKTKLAWRSAFGIKERDPEDEGWGNVVINAIWVGAWVRRKTTSHKRAVPHNPLHRLENGFCRLPFTSNSR